MPLLESFAREHGFDFLALRSLSAIAETKEPTHATMIPRDESMRAYAPAARRARRSEFLCQFAFAFPALLADGTLTLCDQDFNAAQAYGRLDAGVSFRSLWQGARAAALRRMVRDRMEASPVCRMCPYRDRPLNTCSHRLIALDPPEPRMET
jgi:radical SAM protein with 4Fe4S-binding SPASM domain